MSKNKTKINSLSLTSKDNKKININVEEITNGFLIVKNIEYKDKNGWQYETKKIFSETNPLSINNESLADSFIE